MKNILRWIFFLPVAFISSIIFPSLLLTFVGVVIPKGDMTLWLWKIFEIIQLGVSGSIFVGFCYLIVPNHKRTITIISTISYICFIVLTVLIYQEYIDSYWDIIIPSIGAIIACVLLMFNEENKNILPHRF